jgi:phosphohistidine phosphatase
MPEKKTLYLVRHAKSSWKDPSLDDAERPLNKRGKQDAPEMGKRLAKAGVRPDLITSSPAVRALTTAQKIAEEIGIKKSKIDVNENIYTFNAEGLLEVIMGLDDKLNTVMLVGHNPATTVLLNELSDADIDNVPTCGVAQLEMNTDSWAKLKKGGAELVSFDYPKKTG